MRRAIATMSFVLAVLGVAGTTQANVDYEVINLGTLGGTKSTALDINNAGQIVGSAGIAGGQNHAFLYANGSMSDLGTLGGTTSFAKSINQQDQVTGAAETSDGYYHAFIYSGGQLTDLGTLGGTFSTSYAINSSGDVAGFSATPNNASSPAFIYSNGLMTSIATLGGTKAYGFGINDSGEVVGGSYVGNGTVEHAFLYASGVLVDLTPGDSFGVAADINNKGQIAGWHVESSSGEVGFIYDNGVMTDIAGLGGFGTTARSINAYGDVVGDGETADNLLDAYLYKDGATVDLNSLIDPASGWHLTFGYSINDNGYIVGQGIYNGEQLAYELIPVPEPAFLGILIGVSSLSLCGRNLRRKR